MPHLYFSHCSIFVAYFELYSGKLFDLLHQRRRLVCRSDAQGAVHVVGLKEVKVASAAELMALIARGNQERSTGQTGANIDSSRSHAILNISVRQVVPVQNHNVRASHAPLHPSSGLRPKCRLKTQGRLSFIDLAGSGEKPYQLARRKLVQKGAQSWLICFLSFFFLSERAADTNNSDRQTRLESAEINRSLLALKELVRALDQGHSHTPFRLSVLTQVLKNSFVGESRTAMIATVSPNSASCEHTLNTLRYADRVKQLKKGVQVPLPSALPPGAELLPQQASHHPAVRRSSAGLSAYMPHAASHKNITVHHASPGRPKAAPLTARNNNSSLSHAPSAPSLHSSPARPRTASARVEPPSSSHSSSDIHVSSSAGIPAVAGHERHQSLCARILAEEDALVAAHRHSLEQRAEQLKREAELLRAFEGLECTVDQYVSKLDVMLGGNQKGSANMAPLKGWARCGCLCVHFCLLLLDLSFFHFSVSALSARLHTFDAHLKEEEALSTTLPRK